MVVTIAERKARKIEQIEAAARDVMAALRSYSAERGGRCLVFGSVARGDIRIHSDFDVVLDFPLAIEREARAFTEELCAHAGLIGDIHLMADCSPTLLERVRRDAMVLS